MVQRADFVLVLLRTAGFALRGWTCFVVGLEVPFVLLVCLLTLALAGAADLLGAPLPMAESLLGACAIAVNGSASERNVPINSLRFMTSSFVLRHE
jgi:hypothetical protein